MTAEVKTNFRQQAEDKGVYKAHFVKANRDSPVVVVVQADGYSHYAHKIADKTNQKFSYVVATLDPASNKVLFGKADTPLQAYKDAKDMTPLRVYPDLKTLEKYTDSAALYKYDYYCPQSRCKMVGVVGHIKPKNQGFVLYHLFTNTLDCAALVFANKIRSHLIPGMDYTPRPLM